MVLTERRTTNFFSSLAIGFMLFATVVVPPVAGMAFGASSMAAGALFVSVLYAFLLVALGALFWPSRSWGIVAFTFSVVLVVVLIQGALSILINRQFDFERFWQSGVLLSAYVLGAFSLALLARKLPERQADFAVKLVFYALLLSALAGILEFSPFSRVDVWRPVLFFGEPSHFALSFLPFLLYMTVNSSSRMKLFLVFMGLLTAMLLKSLTLVVGVALVAVLAIPLRILVFLIPIAAILLAAAEIDNYVDLDYYLGRLDFAGENRNLSALAFQQGWERAYMNLGESFGIGVGFQQFGIVGSRGESLEDIVEIFGRELNVLDGASVASKFIGEFGLLGVTMLVVYLVCFVKCAKSLHRVSTSWAAPHDRKQTFFLACFVMYCIDLFVRGGGYFSSSGFLFVASVLWMISVEPRGYSRRTSNTSDSPRNSDGSAVMVSAQPHAF